MVKKATKVALSKTLIRAVQRGNGPELKNLLKQNPSQLSAVDEDGKTLLHLATETGNVPVIKLILQRYKAIDINAVDQNGWTPLHCAAYKAHFEACEELLRLKHINVKIANNDDTVPLMYLVRLRPEVIANREAQYKNVLKLMVSRGADVNAINMFGEAPLHAACLRGTLTSVTFLLNNFVDVNVVNAKKETALHWAVRTSKIDIVNILMQYGADPFVSHSGTTPMELAISTKQKSIIFLMTSKALSCEEARNDSAKAGYLSLYMKKQQWERVYCILKEQTIFVYRTNIGSEKPMCSYNIMELTVKDALSEREKRGKPWVFKLIESFRNSLFACESELDAQDWMKSIAQGQRIFSHTISLAYGGNDSTAASKTRNRLEPDDINAHLQPILESPQNAICADCGDFGASWMLQNFGALVCFECADIHNTLKTSTIRSVDFDSWLIDDVMILKCNGNSKHNVKYEANLPLSAKKPAPTDLREAKEQYIKQKYQETHREPTKSSPRFAEQKRALAHRIPKFQSYYTTSSLLAALSIPRRVWESLRASSSIYQKIKTVVEGEKSSKSQQKLVQYIAEKLPNVIGHSKEILAPCLLLIRSIRRHEKPSSSASLNPSIILRGIVTKYEELQKTDFDSQLELIFKWWLPQVVEILLLLRLNQSLTEKHNLEKFIEMFSNNYIAGVYCMTGEYLLSQGQFPHTALDDKDLTELSQAIKTQSNGLTDVVRKILQAMPKSNESQPPEVIHRTESKKSVASNTDSSFSINKTAFRTTSSLSWSYNSDAPGAAEEPIVEIYDDIRNQDSPLLSISQQAPLIFTAMVCSVISELPASVQQNVLGVTSLGQSFVRTTSPDWTNVFCPTPVTLAGTIEMLHSSLELLRNRWPTVRPEEILPDRLRQQLIREIYVLKFKLGVIYALPIPWVIPEAWSCWFELLQLLHRALHYFFVCLQAGKGRPFITEVLSLFAVLVNWTFTKLKEIQRVDPCYA